MLCFRSKRTQVHIAACALLACALAAQAQIRVLQTTESPPGQVSITVETADSVELMTHSLELKVGAAPPITAENITLLPVSPEQAALVLCIDRSGSMRTAGVAAEAAALRKTLSTLSGWKRLPVSVDIIAFSTTTQDLTNGFTDDPAAIDAAVAHLQVDADPHGRTRLNDTILAAVAELRASSATYRRVLVISDGDDEGSDLTLSQLIQQLESSRPIMVDAVGFGELAASESGSLAKAAAASGGGFKLARDQLTLAQDIVSQISLFTVGQRRLVSFNFQPARNGRVDAAQLVYRTQGESPRQLALATRLTTPEVEPPVAKKPPQSRWQWVLKWVLDFRFLLVAALTVVFSVTTVVAVKKRILVFNFHQHVTPLPPPSPTLPGTEAPSDIEPKPVAVPRRATLVGYRWPVPGEGQPVAVLQGREGAASGHKWRLERSRISLGSAADNDLILGNDDFISSHHAWIRAEDHGLYVTDLGSTNGTGVNGQVLKNSSRPLLPGDRISIGRAVIEVMPAGPENADADAGARVRASQGAR